MLNMPIDDIDDDALFVRRGVSTAIDIRTVLRDRRKLLGITQKALAEQMRVSQSWLSRYERGRCDASVSNMMRIAYQLRLSVDFVARPPSHAESLVDD